MRYPSFQFLRSAPVVIDSGIVGPTLMVLGGIHGDEMPGVFAVHSLIQQQETLNLSKGRLILMYGNLQAIRNNTRQGEMNLNRMFLRQDGLYTEPMKETYEYQRATEIKYYLDQADILLDIHSVANRAAVPFVICEENGMELARSLPVPIACSGFDNAHPGGTDGYMNASGKVGLCLECGEHTDLDAFARAKEGVFAILLALGMTENEEKQALFAQKDIVQRRVHVYSIYKNSQECFRLARNFEEFEEVREGTLIGYDGDIPVLAEEDAFLLFPRNKEKEQEECFCLARTRKNTP